MFNIRTARDKENRVIQSYAAGIMIKTIASNEELSTSTVRAILKRNEVPKHSWRFSHKSKVLYTLNENFFDHLDTQSKAYWFGFILADGNIINKKGNYNLQVNLKASDEGHLDKLRKALGSDSPIRVYSRGQPLLVISSKHLINSLTNRGIVPAKSCIVDPDLQQIPDDLLHHFWRGVFDGDGTIGYNNRKDWFIGLCGTIPVVTKFSEFVYETTGFGGSLYQRNKNKNFLTMSLQGNNACRSVVDLLYNEADVCLERKRILARQLISQPPYINFSKLLTKSGIIKSYEKLGTWKKVASNYGITTRHLFHLRKKLES